MAKGKDKILMLGSEKIDFLVGEITNATSGNQYERNIEGNLAGFHGAKIVVENISEIDIEKRTYSKDGSVFHLIRYDRSKNRDNAQIDPAIKASYDGLAEANNNLQAEVATLRRKLGMLTDKDKWERQKLKDAKLTADIKKLEFRWSPDIDWGGIAPRGRF